MDNSGAEKVKQISIVIPAYNEKDSIEKTIRAIPQGELEKMGYQIQVLIVDNDSNDGTGDLARQAGAEVVHEVKRGYGSAYKAGFARATGDIIATADADLTYPMADIPGMVKILEEAGLDFITTNRFALMEKDAMPLLNKVGNTILSLVLKVLFFLNINDAESGMWVFRRSLLEGLKLGSDKWPFSHELKIECCCYGKAKWRELHIRYLPRLGETKLTSLWRIGFIDLCHIFKKRFVR